MIDLKHYKKIKDDNKTAVLRHSNGHEFRVAKNALSPHEREKLASMPIHMTDGGWSPNTFDPEQNSSQMPENDPFSQNATRAPVAQMSEPTQPEPSSEEDPAYQTGSFVGTSLGDTAQAFKDLGRDVAGPVASFGKGVLGVQSSPVKTAAQQTPKSTEESDSDIPDLGEPMPAARPNPLPNAQANYMEFLNTMGHEYNRLQTEADRHINPNDYLEKLGLGRKILNAVGMIIGGMGAGVAGGENPAEKFIHDQIERNIKAQESEMHNKQNLLSEYTKMLGNLPAGKEMLAAIQLGAMSARFRHDATKLGHDPAKQNAALQSATKYDQQAKQLMNGAALKHAMQVGMTGDGLDITTGVPHHLQRDAYKEKKEAVSAALFRNEALKTFDEIADLNNPSNRLLNPIQSKRQLDAKRELYKAKLAVELAHRYTEQDSKAIGTIFKQAFDNPKTTSVNRKTLERILFSPETFAQRYPILHDHKIDIGVPVYRRTVKTHQSKGRK